MDTRSDARVHQLPVSPVTRASAKVPVIELVLRRQGFVLSESSAILARQPLRPRHSSTRVVGLTVNQGVCVVLHLEEQLAVTHTCACFIFS